MNADMSSMTDKLDAMVARRREITAACDLALGTCRSDFGAEGRSGEIQPIPVLFLGGQRGASVAYLRRRDIDARWSIARVNPDYIGDSSAYHNLPRLAPPLASVPIFLAMTVPQAGLVAENLNLSPQRKI
jgi:hypothetical protein